MTLKSTAETLGRTAVSTTYSAVRHPFGTTARAAGLAKDTVGAGLGLVLNRHGRPSPAAEERAEQVRTTVTAVKQTIAATTAQAEKSTARTVEKAAPVAKDAVVDTAEKVADKVEKTADEVEKTAPAAPKSTPAATKAKPTAAKTKPAHEPAEGTAPTGEQVEVEQVQKKATEKKPTQKKQPVAKQPAEKKPATKATQAPAAADHEASKDPRDHIPGPDLATFAPPAPEDLPEPIVIEAE